MARDISTAIESLSLDKSICIYPCCKQTLNNWIKDINNMLSYENYNWRVIGEDDKKNKKGIIISVPNK